MYSLRSTSCQCWWMAPHGERTEKHSFSYCRVSPTRTKIEMQNLLISVGNHFVSSMLFEVCTLPVRLVFFLHFLILGKSSFHLFECSAFLDSNKTWRHIPKGKASRLDCDRIAHGCFWITELLVYFFDCSMLNYLLANIFLETYYVIILKQQFNHICLINWMHHLVPWNSRDLQRIRALQQMV